jgi:nickel/cobalt transporter (NicO) family protein
MNGRTTTGGFASEPGSRSRSHWASFVRLSLPIFPSPQRKQGRFSTLLALRALAFLLAVCVPLASAHPVPRVNHDRTIKLSLLAGPTANDVTIRVDYRLEVDELTVVLDDMAPFKDEIDPAQFRSKGLAYYAEYARLYAPILAARLGLRVGDKPVKLVCVKRTPTLKDENEENLGHLRCDFVFEATAPLDPATKTPLEFRDDTWIDQPGDVRLFFESAGPFKVDIRQAPDEALMKRSLLDLRAGDEDRLHTLRLEILPADTAKSHTAETAVAPHRAVPMAPPSTPPAHGDQQSLLLLLQTHEGGFFVVLLISALFGAVHALTPGHGKTLVAAYLVGQRGTVSHAIFLGIVTTLTHTGAVMILAAILWYGMTREQLEAIMTQVQFGVGMAMVCFGLFLFFQRLRGRADHIHIGAGHHHAPDGSHLPPPTDITWFGLILLGVTGGIIPCFDAIVMLFWAIGMNLLDWALPMLLAFSAGLASVLVLLGILVVKVRGFADSRLGAGRLVKWLPVLSAVAIVVLGFWLSREAVESP